MNKLFKTLTKTPKLTPNNLNQFSRQFFSPNFSPNEIQQSNFQSEIDKNTEIESKNNNSAVKKPSKIPYQCKVSNRVNLIGTVKKPIKFLSNFDGKPWAGTLISQEQKLSDLPLWMPVIFKGDLAHTAMMHLKENDMVHIAGQFSSEPPPIHLTDNQSNIQVLVHELHFVRGFPIKKKKLPSSSKLSPNSSGNPKSDSH